MKGRNLTNRSRFMNVQSKSGIKIEKYVKLHKFHVFIQQSIRIFFFSFYIQTNYFCFV